MLPVNLNRNTHIYLPLPSLESLPYLKNYAVHLSLTLGFDYLQKNSVK